MFEASKNRSSFLQWLRQQTSEPHRQRPSEKSDRKAVSQGPMTSTTLGLYGLTSKDSLELVQRKIQRAVRAQIANLELLYEDSPRLVRTLEDFLSRCHAVETFIVEPGRMIVTLRFV